MFSKIPATFKNRKVCYATIIEIRRSPSAPKTINEKLKKDILANGMLRPLEISNEWSMNCLIGNQRLLILQSLGVEKVPVVYITDRKKSIKKFVKSSTSNQIYTNINYRFITGRERVKIKRKKKKL